MTMPEWARKFRDGMEMIEQAQALQVHALQERCPEKTDGSPFQRCTADFFPPHECRYDSGELPANLADEERWGT